MNDRIGDEGITVTWCPLCGSGMAFAANVGGRELNFGVSGLLYNSDVLLYDRQTESLWSQIMARAVSGPMRDTPLAQVPVYHTSWADWRARHPKTEVLSTETGYNRDYQRNPYAGYTRSETLYFPVRFRSAGFHPKEQVLGLEHEGTARAWPFAELAQLDGELRDTVGDLPVVIRFDSTHGSAAAYSPDGEPLAAVTLYWFAWYAFHPDTEVYRHDP